VGYSGRLIARIHVDQPCLDTLLPVSKSKGYDDSALAKQKICVTPLAPIPGMESPHAGYLGLCYVQPGKHESCLAGIWGRLASARFVVPVPAPLRRRRRSRLRRVHHLPISTVGKPERMTPPMRAGPPDMIAKGSATVTIGGLPAARQFDQTAHRRDR
jgi:hypothetical protein